MKSNAKQQMIM